MLVLTLLLGILTALFFNSNTVKFLLLITIGVLFNPITILVILILFEFTKSNNKT